MAASEEMQVVEQEVDFLNEKDLYKIIGVSRGAKADEIKKNYRKLSLKHHPDKNPNDPDSKEKFQRISEAFSVLSDSKKRLQYDKSGDMDLEDFDMDQFMNMWVGEMMEQGGMVDDMMKEVLPWKDDDDKMKQFMEEKTKSKGKKFVCQICQHSASTKRLMLAHFEKEHKWDCEDWAKETLDGMKSSFESFMKQITGIGDDTGTFVLPDGSKADMSKVKGVPDIRQHMQKKVDKAMEEDFVKEMYRKLDAEGSAYAPTVEEIIRALSVFKVEKAEAEELTKNKEKLLRRLRKAIDRLNEEEDDEAAMMAQMEAMGGFGGLGGKGGGKGDLAGLLGAMGGGGMPPDLEAMLAGGLDDPAMLEALLSGGLGDLGGLGGMGGMGGMGGFGGIGGMPGGMGGMPGGMGGFPGMPPSGMGGMRGRPGAAREPPKDDGPRQDIGCTCGYSCGTMKALEKHLARFAGDLAHKSNVTERPPSPPRIPKDAPDFGDLPQGFAERFGLGGLGGGSPFGDMPPGFAERLGLGGNEQLPPGFAEMLSNPDALPPGFAEQLGLGGVGLCAETGPGTRNSSGGGSNAPVHECICGYTSGTAKALQKHLAKFASDPDFADAHARK